MHSHDLTTFEVFVYLACQPDLCHAAANVILLNKLMVGARS